MNASPRDPGFEALLSGLTGVHERLSGYLSDEESDPTELTTAMLGALMASYLAQVCSDREHPAFLPGAGYHQRMGTPNPDTVYLTAVVDGAGVYRLSGDRGTAPDVSLMPMGGPTAAGIKTYPAIDLRAFELDADGQLDLMLSAERPSGCSSQWCRIEPDVRTLMLRAVSDEWGRHRDPSLAITRLDGPSRGRRPEPKSLAAKLATVIPMVEGLLAFGIRKLPRLRADGFVNAVTTVDYSAGGGLVGQWYHEGVFEVPDGKSLVVEADLRGGVKTLSLALTDALGCTLDWTNAQTSLNRSQAHLDDDGFLRFVVSGDDPGIRNWLDTMGYKAGLMQFRWTGCDAAPQLSFRLVANEEVRSSLPHGTGIVSVEERDAILRERTRGAQLRTLW